MGKVGFSDNCLGTYQTVQSLGSKLMFKVYYRVYGLGFGDRHVHMERQIQTLRGRCRSALEQSCCKDHYDP